MGGIFSIEARDMDTKLLSALESNNTLARYLTLDDARSCVMQGAFATQGKASSIPTVFNWGGNIRPKSFLSFVLLLAMQANVKMGTKKLQMQAKIFKENSLNKLNELKLTTQLLERQTTFSGYPLYQQAFAQLFGQNSPTRAPPLGRQKPHCFSYLLNTEDNCSKQQLNAENSLTRWDIKCRY
ncbi:hypothetical protein Tco_0973046 [Tanacetum coccineum]